MIDQASRRFDIAKNGTTILDFLQAEYHQFSHGPAGVHCDIPLAFARCCWVSGDPSNGKQKSRIDDQTVRVKAMAITPPYKMQ